MKDIFAPLTAALATEKFADKTGDDLYVWTRDRSESLAAANVNSAPEPEWPARDMGMPSPGIYGNSPWQGGWYFNPYYDMFTMVPATGAFWNPFGYGFFSPGMVNYYVPSGGGAAGVGGLAPAVRGNSLVGGGAGLGSPIRSASVASSPTRMASMASTGMSAGTRGSSRGGRR